MLTVWESGPPQGTETSAPGPAASSAAYAAPLWVRLALLLLGNFSFSVIFEIYQVEPAFAYRTM